MEGVFFIYKKHYYNVINVKSGSLHCLFLIVSFIIGGGVILILWNGYQNLKGWCK